MNSFISRINKMVFGASLIYLAMAFGAEYSVMILLSLAAIPIIFVGMFDWHPIEFMAGKLVEKFEKMTWKPASSKTRIAA